MPLFHGIKSFWPSSRAQTFTLPLATSKIKFKSFSPQSLIVLVPSIIVPVLKSIISAILLYKLVLEETLITGTAGFPVGVPKPVVNKIIFAPDPASAVVDSTSFPGVHKRFKPGIIVCSV